MPRSLPSTPQKPPESKSTPPSQEKGGGKKGGGLHVAMSRYQESKKSKTKRKSLDNMGKVLPPLPAELESNTSASGG